MVRGTFLVVVVGGQASGAADKSLPHDQPQTSLAVQISDLLPPERSVRSH